MAKAFTVLNKDNAKKTLNIELKLEGVKKVVEIKDYKDEGENFRAMCRALKAFEDELKIIN